MISLIIRQWFGIVMVCLVVLTSFPLAVTASSDHTDNLTQRHRNCYVCHTKPTEKNTIKKIGPIKINLTKQKINPFTEKPYNRDNQICITCHDKLHRKFGHPIGVVTNKKEYFHTPYMVQTSSSATAKPQLKSLDCKVCHDVHKDTFKYLININHEKQVQQLCALCHPGQAVPEINLRSNDD